VLGPAPNSNPHHHAAGLPLALAAASCDGDVLPNLLAGFRIVDPLCIVPRRVPDHGRALSERATHGGASKTLRQQLQLALDLGKSAHVYVKLHRAPPCPRAGRPSLGRPRSARGRWSCASVPRVSSIRGAWLGVAPPSCGSPGAIGGSHAD